MNEAIKRIRVKIEEEGIQIDRPIAPTNINEFEEKYNIIIPEELSIFYTEIADGCKMIDGRRLKGLFELEIELGRINKDFIFTKYWVWENDETEDLYLKDKRLDGNIELIDIGDAQSWNIIVTGEERGQMWFFTDVGIQPCAPKKKFLSWFEHWLDGNEDYFTGFEC